MSKIIADLIIEEVTKRKSMGIQTYGKALEPFNNRDATQDALEEALDLAHYIKQWQIERAEMIEFILLSDCYCCYRIPKSDFIEYKSENLEICNGCKLLKKLGNL